MSAWKSVDREAEQRLAALRKTLNSAETSDQQDFSLPPVCFFSVWFLSRLFS